jgi:hypothetical protein
MSYPATSHATHFSNIRLYLFNYRRTATLYLTIGVAYIAILAPIIAFALAFAFKEALDTRIVFAAVLLAFVATGSLFVWTVVTRKMPQRDVPRLVKIGTRQEKLRKLIEGTHEPVSDERSNFIDLQVHNMFLRISNSASAILAQEAGASCAVAIKLLWWKSDTQSTVIHSFVRDSSSRVSRGGSPDDFPIEWNTAFKNITYGFEKDDYFESDDLITLFYEGDYINKNDRWPYFYNSTAVRAIRHGDNIVGFFCADTLEGRLSGRRIRKLMEQFSRYVSTGFDLLVAGQHRTPTPLTIGFCARGEMLFPIEPDDQISFQRTINRLQGSIQAISAVPGDESTRPNVIMSQDRTLEAAKWLAAGSTSRLPASGDRERASPVQGESMKVDMPRSTLQPGFTDPVLEKLLDEDTKAVIEKINARSQEEIVAGLIKTGVLTKDGRHLTKKYGGA